ncbi:hypothetical protein HGRIS_008460 [Hohenbuehelia grisea]|uniref:S-adenosyl-L-methionine-dependent methyltransferase n=1 Tax=Hohenbuehelia grisea TaxID=104357 RepID=A0ABR3J895_9AGAR
MSRRELNYPDVDSDSDMDSDSHSSMSGSIFDPPPSESSATSYDVSMRSESPTPSIYSMTSSMRAAAYKLEYGRGLNNYSEVYSLPADDEELDRLDAQHELFKQVMGRYPPPIRQVLAAAPGEIKSVLDLGCGSGSWIMDVARDFPDANCVAVDLVPMQSADMPPNCRSEVDDINLGLEHYYNDFDYVHARLISSGIKDYERVVDHAVNVLRPRGLLEFMEFDFHTYDGNFRRIELPTTVIDPPWWPRWLAFAEMSVHQRGGSADAATHLHRWVSEHPGLEDVVYQDFWVPTSPWTQQQPYRSWGNQMRDDILAFLLSGRPLMLGCGVPEPLVDELEENARTELMDCREIGYIRLQRVYARKRVDYVPPS